MKVEYDKNDNRRRVADLYRIGRCLAIFEGKNTHRLFLTPLQWKLLMDTAKHAVDDEQFARPRT